MPGRRTRNLVIILLVAAGISAAGLGGLWYWAASEVSTAIARWSQEQRARGYAVAYDGPEMGGYPLAVTARLETPAIASPHGWRWSGESILGRAKVWAPLTLDLEFPRRQDLSLETHRGLARVSLEMNRGRGAVAFTGGGEVQAAEMELIGVSATRGPGWRVTAARVHAAITGIEAGPAAAAGPDFLVNGEAGDVTLPEAIKSLFGPTVSRLAFQAAVFGRVPAGPPAEGLAAWREGGGKIAVEAFAMRYGPVEILAQGELRLDAGLRPEGVLDARIGGLPGAMDKLSAEGLIDENAAFALKLSALAMSREEDGTGRPVVDLPITLRDGLLYLGPVALFPLAPVI